MRPIWLAVVFALSLLFAARIAEAQATQGRIPRIGVLSGTRADSDLCLQRLRHGLKQREYVEGKTLVLDVRRSEGRHELIPRLASELVGLNVNLIVSLFSEAHPSVKQATSTIPVVMAASTYLVEQGLVARLAHPGGNITGLATFTPELMAKRVQILKEAVPTMSRIAVIREPGYRNDLIVRDYEAAAQKLGINLRAVEVRSPEDLAEAFQTAYVDAIGFRSISMRFASKSGTPSASSWIKPGRRDSLAIIASFSDRRSQPTETTTSPGATEHS